MIADIVGHVYCEHDSPTCNKRAEAILRYTCYRGHAQLYVVSFVSFVSTGWYAYVDQENTGHVYCPEHCPKNRYLYGKRHIVS